MSLRDEQCYTNPRTILFTIYLYDSKIMGKPMFALLIIQRKSSKKEKNY
jgi:hypothetical protein